MTAPVLRPASPGAVRVGQSALIPALLRAMQQGLLPALLLGLLPAPVSAQFVAPEGSRYHNGSSLALQDEGDGADALARLRTALEEDAAGTVVTLFSDLRADRREQLVSLGPRVDAPALEVAARRLVAAGGTESLAAVLAEARARLAEALAVRDLPVLLDHATRGLALETSREAALAAARLCFEEGRWWEAASLATRAGALPGAAPLAAAARARDAQRTAPGPATEGDANATGAATPGSWVLERGVALTIDDNPHGGLPLVTDGRAGELIFLDARGLFPMDRKTADLTARPFEVLTRLLGEGGLDLPAVSHHALARLGDRFVLPVNALRVPRFDSRGEFARTPTVPRAARLAAVDLAGREFSAAWTLVPPPLPGEAGTSIALGPPLAAGRQVFCLLFRVALTTDVSLLAVSADDGSVLFETPLVNAAQIRRFASRTADTSALELDKTADESAIAERDGILYVCTGHGVYAAVDGLTGHVRHTFRYDRTFSQDPDTYDPAFLFDTGTWRDEPVRLWPPAPLPPAVAVEAGADGADGAATATAAGDPGPERVIVAPGDSRFLYMLAREPGPAGQLILDDPIERLDRLDIAGLVSDPQGRPSPAVLVTHTRGGRGGVQLLGPDGHVLARAPLPDVPVPGSPSLPGQGSGPGTPGTPGAQEGKAGGAPAGGPDATPELEVPLITGKPLLAGSRLLVPTSTGVVSFARDDLSAPPAWLPRDPLAPVAVAGVFAVRDGLATLSPQLPRAGKRGYWYLQWYAPAP